MQQRILVCEDEAAIRSFVVLNLRRAGYTVLEADSGEAALQEMLYPGEYMRLLEAVKDINGFQSRRRVWKEQAKK